MKSFRAFVVELEEKKLVGGQKELDHDKDGDIDGSDFAMMRKKKKNEETDQLDELSPKTMKSYAKKADASISKAVDTMKGRTSRGWAVDNDSNYDTIKKRMQGKASLTRKKVMKRDGFSNARNENEETDQLDELSPATLGNYVNKVNYEKDYTGYGKKRNQRKKGVKTAINKLVTKAGGDKNDVTNYGVPDHLK